MPFLRVFSSIAVLSDHTGVEQLSSLQHLDLAYNLLLEHSQLAPLSLLHCLNTVRTHTCSRTHARRCSSRSFREYCPFSHIRDQKTKCATPSS